MSSESEGSKKPPLNKGLRPTARKEVYTMRTNITYVSVLSKVIENSTNLSAEELDKLIALRSSIEKRNSTKSDKPTKAQVANATIGNEIAEAMVEGVTYSIPDLCALVPSIKEASSQKVSPIMAKLVEAGKVVKSVVKGHNYYTLA